MSKVPSVLLNNGNKMPVIGFGTFMGTLTVDAAPAAADAVELALTVAGYTHIDCALLCMNEKEIGQRLEIVFKGGKVKRDDVFITSKLWCNHHKREAVRKGFNQTLTHLRLEYLDLYLIHWPIAFPDNDELIPADPVLPDYDYLDTWKEMEMLVDEGLVKSIGISNFSCKQVQRLLDNCRIKPAVQQIESHVFMTNQPLVDFCLQRGISVTAYSPFASSPERPWAKETDPRPLLSPEVKTIATKHKKSPAQVLLRHAFQRKLVVVVKSSTVERMKENLEIFDFELSSEDMAILNGLNTDTRVSPGDPTWFASRYYPWPLEDDNTFYL